MIPRPISASRTWGCRSSGIGAVTAGWPGWWTRVTSRSSSPASSPDNASVQPRSIVCNSRGAMTLAVRDIPAPSAREWFETRSYRHAQFADLAGLAGRKRELGVSVSLVLPTREVAPTLGPVLDEVSALNERAPLVDQVVVVDAASADGTADLARGKGAEVYDESELMPAFGPVVGKGDAMWRALSVAHGDLIVFADSDTANFGRHFIYGLLGPLLREPAVRFVKGGLPPAVHGARRHGRRRRGPRDRAHRQAAVRHLLSGAVRVRSAACRRGGRAARPAALDPVLHGVRGGDRDDDRRAAHRRPRCDGAGRPGHAGEPLATSAGAGSDVVRGRARGDDADGRRATSPIPTPTCTRPARPGVCSSNTAGSRCSSARRWPNFARRRAAALRLHRPRRHDARQGRVAAARRRGQLLDARDPCARGLPPRGRGGRDPVGAAQGAGVRGRPLDRPALVHLRDGKRAGRRRRRGVPDRLVRGRRGERPRPDRARRRAAVC